MKRVVLAIHSIAAGGAERVMATMANYWAGEGREVILLTLDDGSTPPFYPLDPRVLHRRLAAANQSRGVVARAWHLARRVHALRAAIREARPDVVISFMSSVNMLALLAATGLGVPVIVSERVDPRAARRGPLREAARRFLYRRAACVVCQSGEWRGFFSPGIRCAVIPNPVAPFPSHRNDAPRQRPVQAGRTMVAMGRLVEQKGFDWLIAVFARLAARHSAWDLEIWGEGGRRAALQAQIAAVRLEKRVRLPGVTREPGRVLRRADLFVLPSRYEGFPNALCEAMAAGVACVAFACPTGPGEIIRDGVDGALVPPGDLAALERTLERLMSDRAGRERLAGRAPEVTQRFAVETVMARWAALAEAVRTGKAAHAGGFDLSRNHAHSRDDDMQCLRGDEAERPNPGALRHPRPFVRRSRETVD